MAETTGSQNPSSSPQAPSALPLEEIQKPLPGQIDRILAKRVSNHIKYPEEYRIEHINRRLKGNG